MSDKNNIVDFGQIIGLVASLICRRKVTVLGVCGYAGAGKTTLCDAIVSAYPEHVFRLNCDLFSAYSLQERQARIQLAAASDDPDHIEAEENPQNWYDWQGIGRVIECLRRQRFFETDRAWNGETGLLDARYSQSLPPAGAAVVLCDCIYLLHDPVRTWLDYTLLVQSSDQAIAARRKIRTKGKEAECRARERHDKFERPYFERYDEHADMALQY